MKRNIHLVRIPAALIVLSGSLLFLAAVKIPLQGQTGAQTIIPLKIVGILDHLIQPRFQRFDLGFGVMDRLVRVFGHNAVRLRVETPEEKRMIAEANAGNRVYVIAFLHCVHIPATAYRNVKGQAVKTGLSTMQYRSNLELRYVAGKESAGERRGDYQVYQTNKATWLRAARNSLSRLMKGEVVNAVSGEWLLAMRPVKASRKECLSCHTNSKQGDVLGVMVYAVNRRTTSARAGRE